MTDISPISSSSLGRSIPLHNNAERSGTFPIEVPVTRNADQAEFSRLSQYLSKLRDLPPIRQDLVNDVQSQIEEGNYMTSGKIDYLIDELADDLATF